MPDRRAGEAIDLLDAKGRRRLRGLLDLLGGALAHALGLAIAPDIRGHNAFVAIVDELIGHRLADQVVADRQALQAIGLQQLTLLAQVAVALQRLVDLEMIAPASQLQPIVAKALGLLHQLRQREIGPLPGKKCDWSCHWLFLPFIIADCRLQIATSDR